MKTEYTNQRQMDFGITAAAIGAGAAIAGQAVQSTGAKIQNNKNWKRTKQMMGMQANENRAMALFNNEQQMKMWEKTGPVGQMEQYKKAGLNPALMYGDAMGAGGSTAAAQAAPVSQGNYRGENTMEGAGQMGIVVGQQLALMNAQKENIEADTANKREQAGNTAADTLNKPKEGENIEANTANTKQATLASQVQTDIQKLQLEKNNATFNDEIQLVMRMRQQAGEKLESMKRENKVDEATKETRIKQVDADYAATLVGNELTRQKIGESQSNVALNQEQVIKIQQEIKNMLVNQQINWQDLNQKGDLIRQQVKQLQNAIQMNDTPASTRAIQDLGKILTGAGMLHTQGPKTTHYHETINYGEGN